MSYGSPADAGGDRPVPVAPISEVAGHVGPGRPEGPQKLDQRSPKHRKRLLKEMGGTPKSEAGVSRALAWLAKNQEADGRWTFIDGRRRGRNPKGRQFDTATTGLAAPSMLAANHTPTRPGPYRQSVAKAMDYLLARQKPDGDLRGRGRMYCQAIATLAIAEAALMTDDPRYRAAAIKGAKFIVKAQNPRTGGWRYVPGDPGDTSVVGWQVMALKSVEKLGYKMPEKTRTGAIRFLDNASSGKHRMLAGYIRPTRRPRPSMVAEGLFSRLMLGQKLSDAQAKEACDYILANMPGRGRRHYYYWYYASLALAQLKNDAWTKWNVRLRDHLLKLQAKSGNLDGSWDTRSSAYGPRGGRVYTTAMAALTLEVYYRYLPMYTDHPEDPKASKDPEDSKPSPDKK